MDEKEQIVGSWLHAIRGQESTHNYAEKPNADGCSGGYGFCQSTWDEAASKAGLDDYVGTAPYQAEPAVQDAVAYAYGSYLYDTFRGDLAYMSNAWYAGEGAAAKHQAEGTLPTTPEETGPSQADYAEQVANKMYGGEFPEYTMRDLPSQDIEDTGLANTNPSLVKAIKMLNGWVYNNYGSDMTISGGWRSKENNAAVNGADNSKHLYGEAVDVVLPDNLNSEQLEAIKKQALSMGFNSDGEDIYHDKGSGYHLHLTLPGTVNGSAAAVFSNPLGEGLDANFNAFTSGAYSKNAVEQRDFSYKEPSFWDKLSVSFMDSFTNTGTADVLQSLWGNLFHSKNHLGTKDDLTQADVDKVKSELKNDPIAQRFVLLNARDSEEIDWLINQKKVDQKRQEEIARFTEGVEFKLLHPSTWHNFGVAEIGALAGNVADPINLISIGEAAKLGTLAKMMSKVGTNVTRIDRAIQLADIGAKNAAIQLMDDYAREKFWGEEKTASEYGWSGATAFMAGAVLGKIGDAFHNYKAGKVMSQDIARAAEKAEDFSLMHAGDIEVPYHIANETIEEAKKLHNAEFSATAGSKSLISLEANGRAFAMNFSDAEALVRRMSGKELPDTTKAFYVPNEDYSVVIMDRVTKDDNIDKYLGHEFAVHSGLRRTLGDEGYIELMDKVKKDASKEGSALYEVAKKAGVDDPEEILAYATENDSLAGDVLSKIRSLVNKGLKDNGFNATFTAGQIKEIMKQEVAASREAHLGIHKNSDGSTAFGGLRYSKKNIANPDWYARYYTLEQPINKLTQGDLGHNVLTAPLRWVGRQLDRLTPFGTLATSASNTARSFVGDLLEDARGRYKGYNVLSAERQKEELTKQLMFHYANGYANARADWLSKHRMLGGRKSFAEFDRAATLYYNNKFGGNTAAALGEVEDEVMRAAEHLNAYRQAQIQLGKKSARMFGISGSRNLIDKDWYEVDNELWRVTTNELRHKFVFDNFKGDLDKAAEFLNDYYIANLKEDIVEKKIVRAREMENAARERRNALKEAYNKKNPNNPKELEELLDLTVTEEDIAKYADEHIPAAVAHMLHSDFDALNVANKGQLGSLNFLKERVPIDTSAVMEMPNGIEFSFDNNLRDYDMDKLVFRNATRFAGEVAVKNTFGSQATLEKIIEKVKKELDTAKENGVINANTRDREVRTFKETVDEIRGFRPDRDSIGRAGAFMRIMRNLAYAKNGANMGFNQMAEVSGTIAYAGAGQLFHVLPKLGALYDNARWGKLTAETIRDAEAHIFGESVESKIFTMNYGDRVIRDALTKTDSLLNDALIFAGDKAHDLGKITSAINLLPKTTDAMIRGVRIQTMMDSLRWANGETFSKLRNPFSDYKLKGSGIVTDEVAEKIKAGIKKHVQFDEDGNVIAFDWEKWRDSNPVVFHMWYDLVQKQADRAIVSGTSMGNRFMAKDANSLTQTILQFKDYSMRALNAQTMRALSSREADDALSAMLSMATNTAVYIARAGATYGAMKALGMDEKAQKYWDENCGPQQLGMVAAIRSTMLGSPLSVFNDAYEAATGSATLRTTVDRNTGAKGKPRDVSDAVGDAVTQLPAIREALRPIQAVQAFNRLSNDKGNKRDFKELMGLLPLPNFIPIAQLLNYTAEHSGYPDKRPK